MGKPCLKITQIAHPIDNMDIWANKCIEKHLVLHFKLSERSCGNRIHLDCSADTGIFLSFRVCDDVKWQHIRMCVSFHHYDISCQSNDLGPIRGPLPPPEHLKRWKWKKMEKVAQGGNLGNLDDVTAAWWRDFTHRGPTARRWDGVRCIAYL